MKYIIHRGITSNFIEENSYVAIKKALIDKDSLGVEFDIRLTKDNVIVLSHNSHNIENTNYNDIIKEKYLTTLDKILDININKILLIDIKTKNNYKKFGNILLTYLNNTNKNIYLASFDKKIINYLNKRTKYKKGIITFKYHKNFNKYFVITNYKNISNNKISKIRNKEIFLWTIKNDKELDKVKKKYTNIDNYYLIINKKEN